MKTRKQKEKWLNELCKCGCRRGDHSKIFCEGCRSKNYRDYEETGNEEPKHTVRHEFVLSQQEVQTNSQHKAKDDIKLSEPPKGKSASADALSIKGVKEE